MRSLVCGLLLAATVISTAPAEAQPHGAGILRIMVEDATPFPVLIAYPTAATETSADVGSNEAVARHDAPVAAGARFPVVLFSHGSGRGPGTPLIHRELLLHLARNGFIVVAPFHPGTGRPFVSRPQQIRKALAAMLADRRFSTHADPERLAMAGFSFGGAVALIVAGAATNLAHLSAYCRDHPDDPRACDGIPTDDSWADLPRRTSADALSLKALVLLEPYAAPFDRDGLASLAMPTLIYHAQQTDLRPDGNALSLARALPRRPQHVAVPGGHFVFVDPCPPALAAQAPQLCADPPGADRAAIHRHVRRQISDFLRANL